MRKHKKSFYNKHLMWLAGPDSNLDTQREFPLSHRIRTIWTWCGNGSGVPFSRRRDDSSPPVRVHGGELCVLATR